MPWSQTIVSIHIPSNLIERVWDIYSQFNSQTLLMRFEGIYILTMVCDNGIERADDTRRQSSDTKFHNLFEFLKHGLSSDLRKRI